MRAVVQRVLSARDGGQARLGAICAGFLKLLPVFIFGYDMDLWTRQPTYPTWMLTLPVRTWW